MNSIDFGKETFFPSKIICVGRNFSEHIEELNNRDPDEIVLFMKPNSSISSQLIKPENICRYEGELCFLMKEAKPAGLGFGLDLTLVDVQKRLKARGLPWEKSKSFDHSAVFSPFIPCPQDIGNLTLELWLNGELRQRGTTTMMINKPLDIFEEIERHFTLEDGDIIMTGTPGGVGMFERNDVLTGKIFDGANLFLEHIWKAR